MHWERTESKRQCIDMHLCLTAQCRVGDMHHGTRATPPPPVAVTLQAGGRGGGQEFIEHAIVEDEVDGHLVHPAATPHLAGPAPRQPDFEPPET